MQEATARDRALIPSRTCTEQVLYHITMRAGKEANSASVIANAVGDSAPPLALPPPPCTPPTPSSHTHLTPPVAHAPAARLPLRIRLPLSVLEHESEGSLIEVSAGGPSGRQSLASTAGSGEGAGD